MARSTQCSWDSSFRELLCMNGKKREKRKERGRDIPPQLKEDNSKGLCSETSASQEINHPPPVSYVRGDPQAKAHNAASTGDRIGQSVLIKDAADIKWLRIAAPQAHQSYQVQNRVGGGGEEEDKKVFFARADCKQKRYFCSHLVLSCTSCLAMTTYPGLPTGSRIQEMDPCCANVSVYFV